MRLKPKPRTREVESIKGLTSKALTENCPDQRAVFPLAPCTNAACEWAVNGPDYMNCTFVVAEAVRLSGKEMSLEEIAKMMGITRQGVLVIQRNALLKTRAPLEVVRTPSELADDGTLPEPSVAAGASRNVARFERPEPADEADFVHAGCRRKLA